MYLEYIQLSIPSEWTVIWDVMEMTVQNKDKILLWCMYIYLYAYIFIYYTIYTSQQG